MQHQKPAKVPWNNWYHVMCHTFGTWLPGDDRGFRTRHHREHVEGDYRNPPPAGRYGARHAHAKSLMTRPPVYLTVEQRRRALDHIVASLKKWNVETVVVAIDRVHLHLLIRCPDHNPRHWVGLAKKESSAYLQREGLAPPGGLWATRCKCEPIRDRRHQVNAANYILRHGRAGAAIWRLLRTERVLGRAETAVSDVKEDKPVMPAGAGMSGIAGCSDRPAPG
jgi:REP element-mobilizing transposase RayT